MSEPALNLMKWTFKLGRFFGIDVFLHFTFLVLLAIIWGSSLISRGPSAALEATALWLAVFTCVLLHEYGHALTARAYGIRTRDITLLPMGGLARLEKMPDNPWQEIVVAVAGPAVNVVIAALLGVLILVTGGFGPVENLDLGVAGGSFWQRLFAINIGLVVFNLLPAFPMDGGRVLRGVLGLMIDPVRATKIAAVVGQGMAVVFVLVAFFAQAPMLFLIAFFVWIGAQAEVGASEERSVLEGVVVRQAIMTDFHTLGVFDGLRDASALVLRGSQQDFPVLEGGPDGRVAGVLTRAGLMRGLAAHGLDGRVVEAMDRDLPVVQADDLLEEVLPGLRETGCSAAPVYAGGQLVGLLTMENIGELMMIRSALNRRRPR
jgi:Zn-dependent protease